jgi:hypothetical protein
MSSSEFVLLLGDEGVRPKRHFARSGKALGGKSDGEYLPLVARRFRNAGFRALQQPRSWGLLGVGSSGSWRSEDDGARGKRLSPCAPVARVKRCKDPSGAGCAVGRRGYPLHPASSGVCPGGVFKKGAICRKGYPCAPSGSLRACSFSRSFSPPAPLRREDRVLVMGATREWAMALAMASMGAAVTISSTTLWFLSVLLNPLGSIRSPSRPRSPWDPPWVAIP